MAQRCPGTDRAAGAALLGKLEPERHQPEPTHHENGEKEEKADHEWGDLQRAVPRNHLICHAGEPASL